MRKDSADKLLYYSDKDNKLFLIDELNDVNFDLDKNFLVNGVFDKDNKIINKENAQKYINALYNVQKDTYENICESVDKNQYKYQNISQIFSESKGYLNNNEKSIRDLRKKLFDCQKSIGTRVNNTIHLQNELVMNQNDKKKYLFLYRIQEIQDLYGVENNNSDEEILKTTDDSKLAEKISHYQYIQNIIDLEKGLASMDVWKQSKDDIIDSTERFNDALDKNQDNRFSSLIKELKVTDRNNVRGLIKILTEMSNLNDLAINDKERGAEQIGSYINEYIYEELEQLSNNHQQSNFLSRNN